MPIILKVDKCVLLVNQALPAVFFMETPSRGHLQEFRYCYDLRNEDRLQYANSCRTQALKVCLKCPFDQYRRHIAAYSISKIIHEKEESDTISQDDRGGPVDTLSVCCIG
jgi:CRISPR/Cas system-associated protein Csx1